MICFTNKRPCTDKDVLGTVCTVLKMFTIFKCESIDQEAYTRIRIRLTFYMWKAVVLALILKSTLKHQSLKIELSLCFICYKIWYLSLIKHENKMVRKIFWPRITVQHRENCGVMKWMKNTVFWNVTQYNLVPHGSIASTCWWARHLSLVNLSVSGGPQLPLSEPLFSFFLLLFLIYLLFFLFHFIPPCSSTIWISPWCNNVPYFLPFTVPLKTNPLNGHCFLPCYLYLILTSHLLLDHLILILVFRFPMSIPFSYAWPPLISQRWRQSSEMLVPLY
jgi:hypothetical protein